MIKRTKKLENVNRDTDAGLCSNRLMKKQEVGQVLALAPRTIDRLAASGKLPKVKLAGAVRFRSSDVIKLMEGGTL